MNELEVAVIGTGWCGGIRAETLSRSALVKKLHVCEIRPDRLAEIKALTDPASATLDYQDIVNNDAIRVVYICTTPEHTHFPIARDCLKAGKHVLLEKPIAMELWQADELIALAERGNLKFTIGYSQRFNTKIAYAKKKIADGTLGKLVSVMVSRHLSRSLGKKIASRVRLSPAAMESTHDLDFVFWLLEPAKPVRIYSQGAYGYMQPVNGSYDVMWSTVTMDNGVAGRDRRRLESAAELPELLRHLDRDHRHRGRAVPRRHPARQLAQHGRRWHAVSDVDHAGRAGRSRVRRPDGPGDPAFSRIDHARPAADGESGRRAPGHGDLHRRRSLRRARRAGRPAAQQRGAVGGRRRGRRGRSARDEEERQGHRPCHRRRRTRRPVPRRSGGAPSGGRMDRHRRAQPQSRRRRRRAHRRRFRHHQPPRAAGATGSHRRHHRHRRAPARRADPGGGRARRADADREAARHRPRPIRPRAQSDHRRQARRGGRLHPALPPQMARRQGEGALWRARRRHHGDLARLHEPARRHRQLPAHRTIRRRSRRW